LLPERGKRNIMTTRLNIFQILILVGSLCFHSAVYSAWQVIHEIEKVSKEVEKIVNSHKDGLRSMDNKSIKKNISVAKLEDALTRGKQINASLKAQVETYKEEKAELLKIQTTLASGLIGAIVTAIIAIAGALLSAKNSRPDRDLKRLVVIEKALELKQSGVSIPKDIALNYINEVESEG